MRLRYTLGGAAIGAAFVAATLAIECGGDCGEEDYVYVPFGAFLGGVVGHLLGAAINHSRR